jgi:hypothetical protein
MSLRAAKNCAKPGKRTPLDPRANFVSAWLMRLPEEYYSNQFWEPDRVRKENCND